MGNHHNWSLGSEPVFNCPEHESLSATPGFARAGQPLFVHIRQRLQKIQSANTVPGLQAHQADAPKLVGWSSAKSAVEVVALIRGSLGKMSIVVANHIVRKGDHALARERDAARSNTAVFGVRHTTLFPVTVRV